MSELILLITEYGLLLVFLNVFLEQVGVPVPAFPTLIVTGALAVRAEFSPLGVFGIAMLAALMGDLVWYYLGRHFGHRVLRTICSISLSPIQCVSQTESLYDRWGVKSLLVAKFIPGLSTIAPPLAGAMQVGLAKFLIFNGLGAAIWVGAGVGLGLLFHDQIDRVVEWISYVGVKAGVLIGILLLGIIAFKWWERRKLHKLLKMARITVAELQELMQGHTAPIIFDVRSPSTRNLSQHKVPSARILDINDLDQYLADLPTNREIVVYCSCPNDATAVTVAKKLLEKGFTQVRPLEGGIDAWIAAGLTVEDSTHHPA